MAQVNGATNHVTEGSADLDTTAIVQALDFIHNPATPNDRRLEALQSLEQVKQRNDSAEIGRILGSDVSKPPLVRHFGLSLLEHVLRYQWHHISEQHNKEFRSWIVGLAETLDHTPQAFIRNKIAELWIELAKRSWALDWYDLDVFLVQLWSKNDSGKLFVLSVLEHLSSDVFEREDSTAILRGRDLNTAIVEVFSSKATFAGGIRLGDDVQQMRAGDEGWLSRITQFVQQSLQNGSIEPGTKQIITAALSTLRSCFTWSTTPPIVDAQCLPTVCTCLLRQDTDIIVAALDVLNALYGRGRMEEAEVEALVYPLCQPQSTSTIQRVYSWSVVGIDDLDSPRYVISKKIAELANHLTDWIAHYKAPESVDFSAFLELLIEIAQHDSLIVSIHAVDAWDKLMQSIHWRRMPAVQSCIQPVLQFATSRVIHYDQLPEDASESAVLFVNEEIELWPDRQAFFATYRGFCVTIITTITYVYPQQALEYLLGQVDNSLNSIATMQQSFDPSTYDRSSLALLNLDAQYTVVDAAYRGTYRWVHAEIDEENKPDGRLLKEKIKSWSAQNITRYSWRDPLMQQRQIKHVVETSSKILSHDTEFAFKVLEHILSAFPPLDTRYPSYSESVTDLHSYASAELRRLALEHASYFVTFYDQLESKFSELTISSHLDEKVQVDLKSTLFLIVQRSMTSDSSSHVERLKTFLQPISDAWSSSEGVLESFEAFVHSQAFEQVLPYMAARKAATQPDWTSVAIDQEGSHIQTTMVNAAALLPLRATRILLSVSTDKLDEQSIIYHATRQLWKPLLPVILSSILRITQYSHALHDPSNWPNMEQGSISTVHRILRDRYWQSGISGGSMIEFHQKVKSTKSTMEGFASSVRGRIRTNLENCYSIIHTMGRLGSDFYSMPQIPELIATQLLQTSRTLSLHHFGTLLSMLPKMIEECPVQDEQHFLTPVMSTLLQVVDAKCTDEWQKLEQRKEAGKPDDALNEEMREESVLRQMTNRAVNMIALWVDPAKVSQNSKPKRTGNTSTVNGMSQARTTEMHDFIFSNIQILEPLLLFCNHAIAFKDTKTCSMMAVTLLHVIPVFADETHLQGPGAAAVREYISSEILKTAITSLHDGYFADYQNQLATLIATIWTTYGIPTYLPATDTTEARTRPALTHTPQQVLLSLPGVTEDNLHAATAQLTTEIAAGVQQVRSYRRTRAVVLQLLEGVRGVRVSELGKFDTRVQKSRILEKYKMREEQAAALARGGVGGEGDGGNVGDEHAGVDLGGVADMFGGS